MTVCFVSNEIWPGTGGGIGRLLGENAAQLARQGVRPLMLLDVAERQKEAFMAYAAANIPGAAVHTVDGLLTARREEMRAYGEPEAGPDDFRFYYYWRAYLVDLCLQFLLDRERVDGIEFADYLGQGYVYFKMRPQRGRTDVPAWVRLHGSAEICDAADGKELFTPDRRQLYDMERFCLACCDSWLAPSAGTVRWYADHYALEKQCLVQPPGYQCPGPGGAHPRRREPARPPRVLFYGKLQHIKGADLLVRAAVEYLSRDEPEAGFLLAGPDMPAANGESTQAQLERLIPDCFRENFTFTGKIDPAELPALALACDLAVIPSRAETFCLAAHELNWIGIPLLLSDIPGLADFFRDGENCLKFNGTAEDLYRRLKQFFAGPDTAARLQRRVT
ncbi:glycosyltransferase family 4 protein, partial [Desulfotomaculum copahuensis]|uniref:glycosyltransferase family 4 protein n=1 Tax=Desulfotomaculum copahuensis TaxID=1838280 RepID=UPI000A4E1067